MNLLKLLRKINDAVRPVHVQGQGGSMSRLDDAKAASYGPGTSPTAPPTQDEKPHS